MALQSLPDSAENVDQFKRGGGPSHAVGKRTQQFCSFYLLTVGTKDGRWVWGRGGGHRRSGGSKNSKLLIVPDRGYQGGEAAQCSARGAPKVSWEA